MLVVRYNTDVKAGSTMASFGSAAHIDTHTHKHPKSSKVSPVKLKLVNVKSNSC